MQVGATGLFRAMAGSVRHAFTTGRRDYGCEGHRGISRPTFTVCQNLLAKTDCFRGMDLPATLSLFPDAGRNTSEWRCLFGPEG